MCQLRGGKQTEAVPPLRETSREFCRKCSCDWIPSSFILSPSPHTIGVMKGALGFSIVLLPLAC